MHDFKSANPIKNLCEEVMCPPLSVNNLAAAYIYLYQKFLIYLIKVAILYRTYQNVYSVF